MKLLLEELKKTPTLTIRELQSKIRSQNSNIRHSQQNSNCLLLQHPRDLNIISPFYDRTASHNSNCKCKYHRKPPQLIKKIEKSHTQPYEFANQAVHHQHSKKHNQKVEELPKQKAQFRHWKTKLTTSTVKNYYFQYIKSLSTQAKIKRHEKLDCHNQAFQEFLKNNYLVILEKKKSQADDLLCKTPHKTIHKVHTEGNIDYDKSDKNQLNKENILKLGLDYEYSSSRQNCSMKEMTKLKKIGFKSTGKTLQQINEEENKERKDSRRKHNKFINSGRPSFFGLIEDQEILREICMRLMNENKRQNQEGKLMVKQLVQSDLDVYKRVISQMEADLQNKITIRNMDSQQTNILIKIVLGKIHRETKLIKNKDQTYDAKMELISELCNKYGWPDNQKIIGLQQFWKIRKSSLKNNLSRKSFAGQRQQRHKNDRKNGQSKIQKKGKSKINIHDSLKDDGLIRMSGFNNDKGIISKLNIGNDTNQFNQNQQKKNSEQKPIIQNFRFNNTKKVTKIGVMKRKERHMKRQKQKQKLLQLQQLNDQSRDRKMHGPVRKGTCFYRDDDRDDYDYDTNQNTMKSIQKAKQKTQIQNIDRDKERNSSLFYGLNNHVQHHIELNKRFLKRIEHQLMNNECEQLVIGIGEGIITKKRKIRAIHKALELDQIKQSNYYNDILKYLQIYEEYCDLVVKDKKQKKQQFFQRSTNWREQYDKEKEKDQIEIFDFLEDIKKQRQLKYVDLKLMIDAEDPRQQLILKIPQYVTKKGGKQLWKKNQAQGIIQIQFQNKELKAEQNRQGCIIQKSLQQKVHMKCGRSAQSSVDQIFQIKQQQQYFSKIEAQFQKKMQKYRNLFKKTEQSQ